MGLGWTNSQGRGQVALRLKRILERITGLNLSAVVLCGSEEDSLYRKSASLDWDQSSYAARWATF